MRTNRRRIGASVLLAAVLLSHAGVSGAQADDPVSVAFDEPLAASVEYGEYWGFQATAHNTSPMFAWSGTAEIHGAPASYHPSFYSYQDAGSSTTTVGVYPAGDLRPLAPGNYTFDVTVSHSDGAAESITTETPASLTIAPANLGIELRILPDPNNPSAAIVTARFTGRFVDEYASSFYDGTALSPAGEWHITLKDEEGGTAIERNFERSAGDDILATSFYWTGAEPDEEYSATAEFVPTGASAANFDISSATTFTYTAPEDARPTPTSTATAKPAADLPEATGFALPLWALLLGIVLIIGVGALVAILSIRLRKSTIALLAQTVHS